MSAPEKTPLLAFDEPSPVEVIRPSVTSPLLIHCDHGGNAVPRSLRSLDVVAGTLDRHVGWDIGAASVSRGLAKEIGATAVVARYSRLVIDLNRAIGDTECVPPVSDGIAIPANTDLSAEQIKDRVEAIYWPYHQALEWELGHIRAAGQIPVVLSIHSFTPALMNRLVAKPRPWHCGIMFGRDLRFADLLIAGLRQVPGMNVGVNEPYSGVTTAYCLKTHAGARGVPHAQIEIRQDLICTREGQLWWAKLLAAVIAPILHDAGMKELFHF